MPAQPRSSRLRRTVGAAIGRSGGRGRGRRAARRLQHGHSNTATSCRAQAGPVRSHLVLRSVAKHVALCLALALSGVGSSQLVRHDSRYATTRRLTEPDEQVRTTPNATACRFFSPLAYYSSMRRHDDDDLPQRSRYAEGGGGQASDALCCSLAASGCCASPLANSKKVRRTSALNPHSTNSTSSWLGLLRDAETPRPSVERTHVRRPRLETGARQTGGAQPACPRARSPARAAAAREARAASRRYAGQRAPD